MSLLLRLLTALTLLVTLASAHAASAAPTGDFSLGLNAEKQSCRAVERFDTPPGARSADIYCGDWEAPSGRVTVVASKQAQDALRALAVVCAGAPRSLGNDGFDSFGQIICSQPQAGAGGLSRYGLIARLGGRQATGYAFPADWTPLVTAARVLSGAANRLAASDRVTPGLAEIQAVYPQGAPGQQAQTNYELLRRRAFEHNVNWNFVSSERDFQELLRAHDAVSPQDVVGRAEILAEIGVNLSNGGRFAEAADVLERAEGQARASNAGLLVKKILNYRALDQLNQGRYPRALQIAVSSEEKLKAESDPAVISAMSARAIDRATPTPERNLLLQFDETTDAERAAVLSAQALFIAGVAQDALGERASAQAYLASAAERLVQTRSPPAWLLAQIFDQEARNRLAAGDPAGALVLAQQGLQQVRLVTPLTRGEGFLLLDVTRAQAALGHTAEALASGRQAVEIYAHQLERPGLPAEQAAPQLALMLDAWSKGRDTRPAAAAEYFETLSLVWDGAAARSAAQLAARLALRGAGETARLYQDSQRTYSAALARRQRLALDADAPATETAAANQAVETERRRVAAAEDALRSVAPAYLELLNPRASLSAMQAALHEHEAYLRISTGAAAGYAMLVTRNSATPYRIDLGARAIETLVTRIRRTTALRGRRLPDFDIEASQRLYQALISPIAAQLQGVDHLQLDVSGALAAAPLAALVETAPTPEVAATIAAAQDYRGVAWFGRRLSLAQSLGAATFIRFRKASAQSAPPQSSLSAFGDFTPAADATAARLALANELPAACRSEIDRALRGLGALPDTATEVRDVAGAFAGPSIVRLGADFTDASFFSAPDVGAADVILLATHGVLSVSSCFPEPALLTSLGSTGDGLIEASRLLDRKLTARLVVLSACDTAGGAMADASRSGLTDGGEALSGLARGFLYAGASGVMATQWKIDSATSAKEVGDFLGAAAGGKVDLASALSAAQRQLYASAETAHPFYWAAFTLVGDGSVTLTPAPAAVAGR